MRKTADALNRQAGLALSRAKILLLGLAYKKNVDDLRESPALRIWQLLEDAGAEVAYFDPHISIIPKTREYSFLAGRRSITWSPDLPARFDCCIVVTDHDDFDYRTIAENARLIIDTRNALRRAGHEPDTIVRA